MVKHIVTILLIATAVTAQTVTTYDSRFGGTPVESTYRAVDIANTDKVSNPDYSQILRSFRAPALIDMENKTGVGITGTIEQAEADLARLINQQPDSAEKTLLKKLVKRLAKDDELSDEELAVVAELFPPMAAGVAYKSNDLVRVDSALVVIAEDVDLKKPEKPIKVKPIKDESKKTK